MSPWRTRLAVASSTISVVLLGLGAPGGVQAQGCVASRVNAPAGAAAMDQNGVEYYLPEGKWQAAFGFRNFRSHRHFVGDVEQDGSPGTTDRSKNEVVNHVYIPEFILSYGVTDKLSATLDLPLDFLYRRNPPSAATATRPAVPAVYTNAKGIGDLTLIGRYWVGDPKHSGHQNLSLGFGFKLPTGKDDAQGTFKRVVSGALQDWVHPVDQSIQPGDGGFGVVAEVQAFKSFGEVTTYLSGSYLFNPKVTNGVQTGRSNPDEAIMSVADQFGGRVGLGLPLHFLSGLAASFSVRLEGVPSSDVFGSSAGFRRPGHSIAIEPGFSYSSKGGSTFSFSFPYLVYRNRTQSYADKLATAAQGRFVNGDAAFADYMFVVGFTRRF
jgi:hypothetical protein